MFASAGVDPFLTAFENGIESKTMSDIHIATTLRATKLEQALQTNQYIDK
jgi:hypothetical protein